MKMKVNLDSLHLALKEAERTAGDVVILYAMKHVVHVMGVNGKSQTVLTLQNEAGEADVMLYLDRKVFCPYIHGLAGFDLEYVELEVDDGTVKTKAGSHKADFQLVQTEVVQIAPPDHENDPFFIVSPDVLKEAVTRGSVYMEKTTTEFSEYVAFDVKGEHFTVSSLTPHGGATCEADLLKESKKEFSFAIHMNDVKLLDFTSHIKVVVGEKSMMFISKQKKLLLSRDVIKFPRIENFFAAKDKVKEEGNSVSVDRRSFLKVVELLKVLGKDKPIIFNVEEEKIDARLGKGNAVIEVLKAVAFNDVGPVAINPSLLSAVSKFGSNEVIMSYLNGQNIVYFDSNEDTGLKLLVMPVMTKETKVEPKEEEDVDTSVKKNEKASEEVNEESDTPEAEAESNTEKTA